MDFNQLDTEKVRCYELQIEDKFVSEFDTIPLNVPCIIRKKYIAYFRKWYKPWTWFKKHYCFELEYLGDLKCIK